MPGTKGVSKALLLDPFEVTFLFCIIMIAVLVFVWCYVRFSQYIEEASVKDSAISISWAHDIIYFVFKFFLLLEVQFGR